jgi:hypothetical protein
MALRVCLAVTYVKRGTASHASLDEAQMHARIAGLGLGGSDKLEVGASAAWSSLSGSKVLQIDHAEQRWHLPLERMGIRS